MRPVNLIPMEQRRGSARGSKRRSPIAVYAILGGLGVGVVCVLALVLAGNQVNDKTGQVAELKAKEASETSVADALRPYGQFAEVQSARASQIQQVADGRFDWDHALDQLARTTPANVWLVNVSGTSGPDVTVDGGSGGASSLREDVPGPAFTITGCTYSQSAVARMMARMRNIDGVSAVKLAKSEKQQDSGGGAPASAGAGGAGAGGADQGCVGSKRVTKFDILVGFSGGSSVAPAGVPQGGGAQVAQASAATTPSGGGQ